MLRDYEMEVLRVNSDGSVTLLPLIIENDSDMGFGGVEPGTTWRVNGVALPTIPFLQLGSLQAQTPAGTLQDSSALIFRSGNVDYVIPRSLNIETITGVTDIVTSSPISTNFLGSTGTLVGTRVLQTQGLIATKDAEGNFTGVSSATFALLDDDLRIETGGSNGGADNETGQPPVVLAGFTSNVLEASVTNDALGQMQLVMLECSLVGGGVVAFEALRLDGSSTFNSFFVPLAGSIDPSAIAAIDGFTVLANTLDGRDWADFGFGVNRSVTLLDGAGTVFSGDFTNERIVGRGGADTLLGGHGEDLVDGGTGNDDLYGGLNNDLLIGFAGNDDMFGGAGNDTLNGGKGSDDLFGGTGRDVLSAGLGADVLTDGSDRDTLRGGLGADVFVVLQDRSRDDIVDFEDGIDRIDVGVGFARLTIIDEGPGEVRIEYGRDTLMLFDATGTLTAADITRADFV